jgi:hypothetical protein
VLRRVYVDIKCALIILRLYVYSTRRGERQCYELVLNVQATILSETLVLTNQTTRCHNTADHNTNFHDRENFTSRILVET